MTTSSRQNSPISTLFQYLISSDNENFGLAIGGQISDATMVSAPRQRNTREEKVSIKEGKTAAEIWPGEPLKAAQKDTDACWTVKVGRPRDKDAARSVPELAIRSLANRTHGR